MSNFMLRKMFIKHSFEGGVGKVEQSPLLRGEGLGEKSSLVARSNTHNFSLDTPVGCVIQFLKNFSTFY